MPLTAKEKAAARTGDNVILGREAAWGCSSRY